MSTIAFPERVSNSSHLHTVKTDYELDTDLLKRDVRTSEIT